MLGDPTIDAKPNRHLRLVDSANADDTGNYSSDDVEKISNEVASDQDNDDMEKANTEPQLSSYYHEATKAELPFQTIRDTLVKNLPKLRGNLSDQRGLLKDLEQARTEKNFDKLKEASTGLNQAEEQIDETNRSIASLINPEAIDRTIQQLTVYKDAYKKHLEDIQELAKNNSRNKRSSTFEDRVMLGRFVDFNKEELQTVDELIDFCLQERTRIHIEQMADTEEPESKTIENPPVSIIQPTKKPGLVKRLSGIFTRKKAA